VVPGSPVGTELLSLKLLKKVLKKVLSKKKSFAAWVGSGGEVYLRAEGRYENRHSTGGCSR